MLDESELDARVERNQILPEVPDLIEPRYEVALFPYDVALIIDGTIFQIMNLDGQQAAQYLSQPKFIRVLPGDFVKIGWKYIDGEFIVPMESDAEGY